MVALSSDKLVGLGCARQFLVSFSSHGDYIVSAAMERNAQKGDEVSLFAIYSLNENPFKVRRVNYAICKGW